MTTAQPALINRAPGRDTGAPQSTAAPDSVVSSFEAIFVAHYRDVARYVLLSTRGLDDTEEIVAETFARGFAAWRTGRGPAGRPLPWLLVIARRIAVDRWRRRRLISWLPFSDTRADSRGSRPEPRQLERGANYADATAAEFWLWIDALCKALPAPAARGPVLALSA